MKLIIKIFILLLLSSSSVFSLILETVSNLNFGTSYAGDTVIILGDNSCSVMGGNANIGKLRVLDAVRNQSATIEVLPSAGLSNGGSSIPISTESFFCDKSNSSSVLISGPTAVTLVKANNNNNIIYIGGTISIGGGASTGAHSGTIDVTITY